MEAGGCTYLEIKSFRVLGNLFDYRKPNVVFHPNSKIDKAMLQLDVTRKRLAEIITKYEDSRDTP